MYIYAHICLRNDKKLITVCLIRIDRLIVSSSKIARGIVRCANKSTNIFRNRICINYGVNTPIWASFRTHNRCATSLELIEQLCIHIYCGCCCGEKWFTLTRACLVAMGEVDRVLSTIFIRCQYSWGRLATKCGVEQWKFFVYLVHVYALDSRAVLLLMYVCMCLQMEAFPALLALCVGNSPVTGEFPSQRPVTRGFDVFFDLCLNKRLSKQSWGWSFEAPLCSLWRHCNMLLARQILGTLNRLVLLCFLLFT